MKPFYCKLSVSNKEIYYSKIAVDRNKKKELVFNQFFEFLVVKTKVPPQLEILLKVQGQPHQEYIGRAFVSFTKLGTEKKNINVELFNRNVQGLKYIAAEINLNEGKIKYLNLNIFKYPGTESQNLPDNVQTAATLRKYSPKSGGHLQSRSK